MSNRDVLMITARKGFAESLFAGLDGPPVQSLSDDAVTPEQWRDTALLLVDAVTAPELIARGFPHREGVIVVSDEVDSPRLWPHAVALGAGSVIVLPDGWPYLRAAVRDVGRGAAVIAILSAGDASASAFVASAVALESCASGQSCLVLDQDDGPGSVNSYVAEVEDRVVGEPGGRLHVASPSGSPVTEFELTGAVRVSRIGHDLVVMNIGLSDNPLLATAVRLSDVVAVVGTSGHLDEVHEIAERCRATADDVRLLELAPDFDQRTSLADDGFRAACWAALTLPAALAAPTT
ncbi:hypothetical protein ACFYOT_25335 [Saccharothrix saharensis]|uniref:hypothetical protein n=1 Tax=Saccharothrix saharensis TaxID=571190 RepID=UPI00368EE25E